MFKCYRAICDKPHEGYFNASTRRYYCSNCAKLINKHAGFILCSIEFTPDTRYTDIAPKLDNRYN